MNKSYMTRSFRPWPENEKRLELAGKLGVNVSEVINKALEKQLPKVIEEKTREMRILIAQVPA